MCQMLLSIKPEYAQLIFEGKKQYEFRKTKPQKGVDHIIFYATFPQKQVVGEATIDKILEGSPKEIWEIAKTAAGITKDFYFSYYAEKSKAIAYRLKNVVKYDEPLTLKDLGVLSAPQSYQYLENKWIQI